MAHADGIFGYLTALYAGTLQGGLLYSGRALVTFILVGPVLWVISVRSGWLSSLRKLPGHLFPSKLYFEPTARITHWNYLFTFLIWGPLFAVLAFDTFKLAEGMNAFLTRQFGTPAPMLTADWAVIATQAFILTLCTSFAAYLTHLALHKVPVLWSFHRAHHSVEALTLPAVTRNHPGEFIVNATCISSGGGLTAGPILYVAGLGTLNHESVAITVGILAWRAVHNVFEHSHIPISFGPLDRIFGGPVLHVIHHSAEPQHRDKNLGGFFPFLMWDWIFGTLYLPKKGEVYRWGLNEAELGLNNPHLTLCDYYLEPIRHAWAVIKGRRWDREANIAMPPAS